MIWVVSQEASLSQVLQFLHSAQARDAPCLLVFCHVSTRYIHITYIVGHERHHYLKTICYSSPETCCHHLTGRLLPRTKELSILHTQGVFHGGDFNFLSASFSAHTFSFLFLLRNLLKKGASLLFPSIAQKRSQDSKVAQAQQVGIEKEFQLVS